MNEAQHNDDDDDVKSNIKYSKKCIERKTCMKHSAINL